MSVYVDSFDKLRRKLGIENNGPAQAFFTEACYKAMDKYVPMDNGDLRTNVSLTSSTITYESPYASYQYYGIRSDGTHATMNFTTPGTGPYWDDRMKSVDMDKIEKQVQNYIRRNT